MTIATIQDQPHTISMDDVQPLAASHIDPTGCAFRWDGGVYRAVSADAAALWRGMMNDGTIEAISRHGFVGAEASDLRVEGFDLVLRHREVKFVTYPLEWPSEMLRAAALSILDLSEELVRHGATLRDAHPWNVLFEGARPVFVDAGSIIRGTSWPIEQYYRRVLYPMYLIAAGRGTWLRRLMTNNQANIYLAEVTRLIDRPASAARVARHMLARPGQRSGARRASPGVFASLRREVSKIKFRADQTDWTRYRCKRPVDAASDDRSQWNIRTRNVHTILERCKPKTLLDIGASRGWFSEMAAGMGASVIAADIDETSANAVFKKTQGTGLNIQPTLLDVCNPTPALGLGWHFPSQPERIRCEFVLCLAVTHHLFFKRNASFDAITRMLAGFTSRWLLVEFVPSEDEHVQLWNPGRFPDYTVERFRRSLGRHFGSIEVLESTKPRLLLMCEDKRDL